MVGGHQPGSSCIHTSRPSPCCRYDFPSPWWDSISKEAISLVRGLLTVDPKKRLTAKDVLGHEWIRGAAPHTAIDTSQLKKFNASRKLKQAAQKIMAMKRLAAADAQ